VIAAALELFARHGVGGTSLQMIADEIGVTKAAVYHQYKSKDEIVLAAAQSELVRVEATVAAAEAQPTKRKARDHLIAGMIDLAIDDGRTMGTVLSDPVIVGFFEHHLYFRDVMHRMSHVLVGDDAGPEARVRTAMLVAAISGAVMHPFVADLSDEVLRGQLVHLARRFLGVSG
jgi:AcrR family transcriptional regulator